MLNNFQAFDPLKAKSTADTEVAAIAQKREIKNILGSYVGWYDPFCELIQNSLDSVEERSKDQDVNYEPTIWITVNIKENSLIVTDNGVGLDEKKFTQFLCPDISFKSGATRGHKGVGATYLAYGFNFLQVASKCYEFNAVGKMEGARKWLDDPNPSSNPHVKPDNEGVKDSNFVSIDRGVSVYVKFDKDTHPKDLRWLLSDTAESWYKILTVKTGLGAFTNNPNIQVILNVVDRDGNTTELRRKGIEYFQIKSEVQKSATIKQILDAEDKLFKKQGANFRLPASLTNLDAFYEDWSNEDLIELHKKDKIKLESDELALLETYTPKVYIIYVSSVRVWDAINNSLKVRSGAKIIFGGIQIAANNMPQGELIQIPLNRNIGRQNQIHCLIHFDNCSPDLGRKGFRSDITEFAKKLTKLLADGPLLKIKYTLRPNTGGAVDLRREQEVENWRTEMAEYERNYPLEFIHPSFFLPSTKISITSVPSREQDVIALFNQMIAGGVIRGIKIMSTNERFTYDGLYKVVIEAPMEHHLYHSSDNPLGISQSVLDNFTLPFITNPKILEYKFSLDGLIENIEDGTKNSNDIGLVIVWNTGIDYQHNYKITSYLDPDNLSLREYHGVTHCITNINTGQKEMDLIVLSELIEFLNDQETSIENQRLKYEDYYLVD